MKANRAPKRRALDNQAQVGIGTMIVFIASVLVAAIAAGVLIGTSGKLQERSQRTGNEVTSQVASNLNVVVVQGRRVNDTADLSDLNITVALAAGADKVDLSQMRIQINTGANLTNLAWENVPATLETFNATELRDADGSFTPTTPVLTAGDLVWINVNLTINGLELSPREELRILLIPEIGTAVRSDFIAPQSFGTDLIVQLR